MAVIERVDAAPPLVVERWADRLLRQSTFVVVAFLGLVTVLRTGVVEYRQPLQLEIAEAFPRPVTSYRGGAVISPILANVFGVDSEPSWFLLHLAATAALFAALILLIWRRFPSTHQRLFVTAVVLASGLPVTALVRVGHYDIWLHIGALLVVFSKTPIGTAAGGLLMGFTNVEQTAVALVTLGVVVALLDPLVLRRLAAAGGGLVVAWASIRGWYAAYDVPTESRADFFGENLRASLQGFKRSAPVQAYSWFSAAWIAVLSIAIRPLVLVALIALPALSAITTVDGTRVFVACVLPAFLFLVANAADHFNRQELEKLTVWTVIVMCVTPGLSTFVDGMIVMPWQGF
jgi:hypothetical protein